MIVIPRWGGASDSLIDAEEDPYLRAVLVGTLREGEPLKPS
jgi:hypothetical protein